MFEFDLAVTHLISYTLEVNGNKPIVVDNQPINYHCSSRPSTSTEAHNMSEESKILKLVKREEPPEQSPSELAISFLEDVITDIKSHRLNILKLGLILMIDDPAHDGYNISYQDLCVHNLPEAIGLIECAKQVVLSSD